MSLNVDRRAAVAAGAATVALPLAADAANYGNMQGTTGKTDTRTLRVGKVSVIKAPVVEIFDSRGCDVKFANYKGPSASAMEDEQCVKVSMQPIKWSQATAAKINQQCLSFSGNQFSET